MGAKDTVNIEDIRLTESERLAIASRHMYHALPDKAVDEAADTATDEANKWWLEWLGGHLHTDDYGDYCLGTNFYPEWQALKKLVSQQEE